MTKLPWRYLRLYPGPNREQLLDGFYPQNTLEVNGESFHRQALGEIFRWLRGKPGIFYPVEAFIAQEPENEFDIDALAVYIHEKRVGYIPKKSVSLFDKVLDGRYGDCIWVDAAIRYVKEIKEYRVRLMIQMPPRLDTSALMFIEHDSEQEFEVWDEEHVAELIQTLPWHSEQISRDDFFWWTDATPIVLTEGSGWEEPSSEDGYVEYGETIDVKLNGIQIATILDKEAPDLVKVVKNAKLPVLAAVSFREIYSGSGVAKFSFQSIPGFDERLADPKFVFGS